MIQKIQVIVRILLLPWIQWVMIQVIERYKANSLFKYSGQLDHSYHWSKYKLTVNAHTDLYKQTVNAHDMSLK